jgi:hypothetical protein
VHCSRPFSGYAYAKSFGRFRGGSDGGVVVEKFGCLVFFSPLLTLLARPERTFLPLSKDKKTSWQALLNLPLDYLRMNLVLYIERNEKCVRISVVLAKKI